MTTPASLTRIVLAARPGGAPTLENFRLEHAPIPQVPEGGVLLRTLYLSLDPYMRGRMDDRASYAKPVGIGETMTGESVAEVIASRHKDYAEGDIVCAATGWASHALSDGTGVAGAPLRKLDPSRAPVSTGVGVLGMPGFTAWSGLVLLGRPKAGETVCVAAASGPVGSLVGQLAKLRGCRTIAIAGGAEKVAYCRDELGFDAALDHRADDFAARLAQAAPKGIDVYFENVGGAVWQAVLPLLNPFARVPVCGLIAQYSGGVREPPGALAATMRAVLTKSLTIRGFINYEFAPAHYGEFLAEVGQGVAGRKIRYREDVTDGLENAPAAFLRMLQGGNFGKTLVRVAA